MTDLWVNEWPTTNYIINSLLRGNKSIDYSERCVLKRFIEGYSKAIVLAGQQGIKASYLDSETEITTAVQLYQYHLFLTALEYCKDNNNKSSNVNNKSSNYDSAKLITFLKNKSTIESIQAAINELNPYVIKSYIILLTNLLQKNHLASMDLQFLVELLIDCARKINISFLSYHFAITEKQNISGYWETLTAINNYLIACFIFTHYPQRSDEIRYYLNRALSSLAIVEEYLTPNPTDPQDLKDQINKLNIIEAFGNVYSGFAISSSDDLKQLIINLQNNLPQDFISEDADGSDDIE